MSSSSRAAILALALVLVPAPAHADKAAADVAFAAAKRLMAAGKVEAACPKFELSFKEDPQLGTLLNLADCHQQLGKLATAWAEFRAAIELASNRKDRREKFARKRVAELDARISRLVINAETVVDGLVVKLDDRDVTALLGVEIPVDPGEHTIASSAPGHPTSRSRIKVEVEGSRLEVSVPPSSLLETTTEEAPPPPRDDENPVAAPGDAGDRPRPGGGGRSRRRLIAVAAGGVGVIATGVGLYFGRQAFAAWSDSKSFCDADRNCDAQGRALVDDSNRAARNSNIFVGIGIGALAAGAVLWITAPAEAAVTVTPAVSADGAGGTVTVRF